MKKVDMDQFNNEADYGIFTGTRSVWFALFAACFLIAFSGCSQLMGGLRPDLNDEYKYEQEPTYGGRLSENGLLKDDGRSPTDANSLGHNEDRASPGRMGGQGSWLTNGEDERNLRSRPSPDDNQDEDAPKLANRPNTMKKFKNGMRATRDDFVDDSKSDGSLWTSDGQTNYFLTKNRTKAEGDIITVTTDEEFVRDVAAEIKRTLSPDERDSELDLAQERMRRKTLGLPEDGSPGKTDQVASNQSGAARAPASAGDGGFQAGPSVPTVNWAEVDLRKSIEMKAGDPVMMEVLERYPNGNYKLRGLRRVRMSGRTKMVSVLAIAKASDIADDETIPSGKLYEYRIESVR